jgi:glutamyl-tRNA reductase
MHLTLIGLSHHTAPIEVRDQVALTESLQTKALSLLKSSDEFLEAVLLSTCNRSEVYAATTRNQPDPRPVEEWFHHIHGLSHGSLSPYLYRLSDEQAIRHLFRVVSSLDSMVMGEQQILSQVKSAYLRSLGEKTTGVLLNRLFERALEVGKLVRERTDIGIGSVSVSSVAVELARKIFKDLRQHAAMLIGAGETAELTARYLIENGIKKLFVANRTYERAEKLAMQFNGTALRLEDGLNRMKEVDIVISSTSSPLPVLDRERMTEIMHSRRNRPIFLIDIAAPRDIDPQVRNVYNAFLYDIDDLQAVIDNNADRRRKAAERAERIVDEEVDSFLRWYQGLAVTPTISRLRTYADAIRTGEVERALTRLSHLADSDRETIEQMSRAIVNKILHTPTIRLKESTESGFEPYHLHSLRHLFGLDEYAPPSDHRNPRESVGSDPDPNGGPDASDRQS